MGEHNHLLVSCNQIRDHYRQGAGRMRRSNAIRGVFKHDAIAWRCFQSLRCLQEWFGMRFSALAVFRRNHAEKPIS